MKTSDLVKPKTGKSITLNYYKNLEKAPNLGKTFAQDIEPSGQYLGHDEYPNLKHRLPNYEYGTITFSNPLVLDWITTTHGGWKTNLSNMFGGSTGKKLSAKIMKAGYDGIITVNGNEISEMVNLNGIKHISESLQNDISMHDMADEVTHRIISYFYGGGQPSFELEIANIGNFYALRPETINLDSDYGIDQLLFLFGVSNPNAIGMSGQVIDGLNFEHYTTAIAIYCLSQRFDSKSISKNINSVAGLKTIQHEFIHYLDMIRTKKKNIIKPVDAKNKSDYYNHPSEYNAYYHGIADNMLSFLKDVEKHQNDKDFSAKDLADIYGITPSFSKTIDAFIKSDTPSRKFVEWLRKDRHRSLLKRLYILHQTCLEKLV